jgi:TPR repeat protein
VAFAYEKGVGGVERNLEEATEHYKVAAGQDIAEAQYRLACIFKSKLSAYVADIAEFTAAHKGTEILGIKT